VLIAVGVLAAYVGSVMLMLLGGETFFEAGAMLVTFVLFGHWMEMRSRRGTNEALRALFDLVPPQATVLRDGQEVSIPSSEVQVGEIVVLKPPGLISTEPRGIPVGPTVVSGDVAPMAGGVAVITCAKLGPLGNSVETVMAISKPAIPGLWSFRIGITRLRSRRGAGRVSRMFATGFRREL